MSDASGGNLHVFYRYTVPGTVFVLGLLLALPSSIASYDWTNNPLVIAVIVGNVIIAGWTSYHAIYPLWKKFLMFVHIYPKPDFLAPLSEAIRKTGKENELSATDIWSFYLWNQGSSTIRDRIRMLADYGHSLFLVALTFLLFPLALIISKFFLNEKTIFETASELVIPSANVTTLEIALAILGIIIGVVLLYYGRKRTLSAYNVQTILFNKNSQSVLDLVKHGIKN